MNLCAFWHTFYSPKYWPISRSLISDVPAYMDKCFFFLESVIFSVKYLQTYFHHLWMPTQGRRVMWVGLPAEYAEQTPVGGWGAQTLGGCSHPRGHQGHPGIQQDLLPILLLLDLLHHRLRCQAKSWFKNECQRNMKWWGGVTHCEWHSQEGQEPDLDQLTAGRQQEDASLMMRVMMMMILMMPLMESDKRLEWLLVFMSEGNLN